MRKPVTKSSPLTKNSQNSSDDELQTPTAHNHRPNAASNIGWSVPHVSNTVVSRYLLVPRVRHSSYRHSTLFLKNWPLSTTDEPSPVRSAPISRPRTTALNKIPSDMPTRTDNKSSDQSANRWRLNNDNQFVDTHWDLTTDIMRLKITEGSAEADDVHAQLRTPPKAKIATVTHLGEGSPLDTSSSTSAGSSPQASEHEISISHSRGSSTDTTVSSSQESIGSVPAGPMLVKPSLTVSTVNETKERPHSFSGGLSAADLHRLQQAGDASELVDRQGQFRESIGSSAEQLSYPSIANHIHRPQPQPHPQMFDYSGNQSQALAPEELMLDYNTQRNYQGVALALPGQLFVQGRPNNNIILPPYRQPPRGYQGVVANPQGIPYPNHTAHLSLGNTQQLYDMMLPGAMEGHHPAVARVQQQHNVFRPTHHHSASDPSVAMREVTAMTLMNNGIQPSYAPGLFQPGPGMPAIPMYPNQFYAPSDQYSVPDAMTATRIQPQYSGQYGIVPPQSPIIPTGSVSSPTTTNGQGPSANNRKLGLYKTELCRSWEEKGTCRYGTKCQFAHGEDELRKVARHPKVGSLDYFLANSNSRLLSTV